MTRYIILSLAFILSCGNSQSEILITKKDSKPDDRIEVVLLGVWHFANPGADEYNTQSDDYFAPKRQKEINDLNQKLAKFNPDKIFVENRTEYHQYFDSLYQSPNFNPKDLSNDRGVSEDFQIGYKLGKILDHKRIYGADADGLWLGNIVHQVAEEQYPDAAEAHDRKMMQWVKSSETFMKNHTITDRLIKMNHPDSIIAMNEGYLDYLARIIDHKQEEGIDWFPYKEEDKNSKERLAGTYDQKYIGAELVAEWYKRNIKIYSKILENTNSEDKRIFVLFGAGHIRILKHLLEDNPKFKIVEVNDYLVD